MHALNVACAECIHTSRIDELLMQGLRNVSLLDDCAAAALQYAVQSRRPSVARADESEAFLLAQMGQTTFSASIAILKYVGASGDVRTVATVSDVVGSGDIDVAVARHLAAQASVRLSDLLSGSTCCSCEDN